MSPAVELLRATLPSVPAVNLLPGIRKTGAEDLQSLTMTRAQVRVDADHVAAYAEVCGFAVDGTVPVTYWHLLGFPLHLRVMAEPGFPFPALGCVHVANTITRHHDVPISGVVDVTARPVDLLPHPRGRTVDLLTTVSQDGVVVWEGRSTYLRRRPGSGSGPGTPELPDVPASESPWPLAANLGRRYAAVAGDYNPIHLYPLTARVLGFKRPIAHGMWSLARCLAELVDATRETVTLDVVFRKPLLLPGAAAFGSRADGAELLFSLSDPATGAPHLKGRLATA